MEEIEKTIAQIYESAKSNLQNDPYLLKDMTFAGLWPAAVIAYYRQKLYDINEQIYSNVIGKKWIEIYDYKPNVFENGKVKVILLVEAQLPDSDYNRLWEQLVVFARLFLIYQRYNDIINREEPDNELRLSDALSSDTIIGVDGIILLWKYNKFEINDTLNEWKERFIYPNDVPVKKIDVEIDATDNSNKLVVLAILKAIQGCKEDKFDYDLFVEERFGISGFRKAISTHNYKNQYKRVYEESRNILKYCKILK